MTLKCKIEDDKMAKKEMIQIEQSPFYNERHHDKYTRGNESEKVDFKLSKKAYDDIMAYFKGRGLNKSDGFREIIYDKLESINTFKRNCFNNIELIMLLPKTRNETELNEKSQIIALYNTNTDFTKSYQYNEGFDKKFNISYDLNLLDKGTFPFNTLQALNPLKVFGMTGADLMDWDHFSQKIDEKYGMNFDNCLFVRFPLNNYLDVKRDGQFQHPRHNGHHLGIYAFSEFGSMNRRYYMLLQWEYHPSTLLMSMGFEFINSREFLNLIENSDYSPLNKSYESFEERNFSKKEIAKLIEEEERSLNHLKDLYNKI